MLIFWIYISLNLICLFVSFIPIVYLMEDAFKFRRIDDTTLNLFLRGQTAKGAFHLMLDHEDSLSLSSFGLIISWKHEIDIHLWGHQGSHKALGKAKSPALANSQFSVLRHTIPRKKLMIKYQIFTRALEIAKWRLERNKGQEWADLDWEICFFWSENLRCNTKGVKRWKKGGSKTSYSM